MTKDKYRIWILYFFWYLLDWQSCRKLLLHGERCCFKKLWPSWLCDNVFIFFLSKFESLSLAPFSRLLLYFYKYGSFCGHALPLVEQPIFVYYKNKLREGSTEREILKTICQKQARYLKLEVCQWWRKKLATLLPGGLIQTVWLFLVIMWSS